MNKNLFSNTEFSELKDRINKEIKRRSTFRWWDPLYTPSVGEDKAPPMNIPDNEVQVDDKTYTINTPSEGSIERTRNIERPIHGDNPAGGVEWGSSKPNTSAARIDVDELRNYLVGLSKINDINLFYGRDEKAGTAFRNPQGIEDLLKKAEGDNLHEIIPFIWNAKLVNGEIIIEYEGAAPDIRMDDDYNIILRYEIGDKYEYIASAKFYIKDYDLILDDVENVIYRKFDPNHCSTNTKIDDMNTQSEYLSTYRFGLKGDDLIEDPTYRAGNYIGSRFSLNDDGELILKWNSDNSPDMYMEDGNLIIRYGEENVLNIKVENDEMVVEYEGISPDISLQGNDMILRYDIGSKYEKAANIRFSVINDKLIMRDLGSDIDNQFVFDEEDGIYVLKSGEKEGEEIYKHEGLGPLNFFDDYGAEPGDGNYHPYNKAVSPIVKRDQIIQDNNRKAHNTSVTRGGIKSSVYGQNPRNPAEGDDFPSRAVYKGSPGSCGAACTGLCYVTCDEQCSESCTSTCSYRCGNACTATCGNACTGCSTLCYSSCKTKCENTTGYACLKAGAKAVKITTTGGKNGIPAKNNIVASSYSCIGCSYSCQFYPNKKTECWDANCMSRCFNTCMNACSGSCSGGCIDNASENESYKVGQGRGCSGACTINCVGVCQGTCQGQCVETCWHACKQLCSDNCTFECSTNCGSGCASNCKNGCTGCDTTCESTCRGAGTSKICVGCSSSGGCASECSNSCNTSCIGSGCSSLCGTESAGACTNNCRINCSSSSCASLCENQCSDQCTTCINTCGWSCGACSSMCSTGCGAECEITCTATCENSCSLNCTQSCSEACGGCSNLCFSCTGMCIGVCSLRCENGCSSCDGMCGWWCDVSCSQQCFSNCDNICINTCNSTCSTYVTSETTNTEGPERPPTAEGYHTPNPSNRVEEQESFMIRRDKDNG